jgi:pimeloyl-ACP methyl ester carboxylesterase
MTRSEPSKSGFIPIGKAKLFYEEAGKDASLVLIHAGIADRRMWDDQFPLFSRNFRVLRYDMRGFGQTEPGDEAFADWEDLVRLLQALEIDAAVVVGVSMGARVAVELALMRPELVRALVLVAPGLFDDEPRSAEITAGWRAIEEALEAGEKERAIDLEVHMWVDGPHRDPGAVDPTIRQRVYEMNARVWELEEQVSGREKFIPPAVTRLADVRAPALVIAGDADQPDILRIAERLEREIANAHKVTLANAAHMLNMEQPERFNELVIGFAQALPN